MRQRERQGEGERKGVEREKMECVKSIYSACPLL